MKKYLFVIGRSPYESTRAAEILELAMAISAFDQTVSILFVGKGILQLIEKQQGDLIGYKNFTKAYTGLRLFDIKDVFVAQSAMQQYGSLPLAIQPEIVDDLKIADIIATHDIVLDL